MQLNCSGSSTALFTGGASTNLGMGTGIVLTTGDVEYLDSSASWFSSGVASGVGDPLLDPLLVDTSGATVTTTTDACILEFDVTVVGDTLMIDYIFGSEEYPEFVCTGFNDVFAFQISGPAPAGMATYDNYNIARVPGSDLPVCINNVNGIGCNGIDNSAYYVDNDSGATIVYDGFTVPLTAKTPTIPNETYHMRFAVADAGDQAYDSGVFLKSGSLKSAHAATGIATLNSNALSSLKPNPTTGATVLENKTAKPIEYTVLSMMGQTLLKGTVDANAALSIDLSAFGTGHYLVRSSSGAVVTTQRIEVR